MKKLMMIFKQISEKYVTTALKNEKIKKIIINN